MAILNFLPEFKIVEPNRLTGLVMGHVVSQFPLDPTFNGIIDTYEYDLVENVSQSVAVVMLFSF
jgi:hypothetical protein